VDTLNALFRWLHILAGIIWIGMLYFFNWVNGPFAGTLDAETKKKVVPELMPRALYWFRWGAAWTWVTGVLLLTIIYYHGGLLFEGGVGAWGRGGALIALTFLAPFLYDALQKSGLGKDPKLFGTLCFVLVALVACLMGAWGGFSYRAVSIHIGTLFGSTMAFNVWFRIWPAQQTIIKAVKEGTAECRGWPRMGRAQARSRATARTKLRAENWPPLIQLKKPSGPRWRRVISASGKPCASPSRIASRKDSRCSAFRARASAPPRTGPRCAHNTSVGARAAASRREVMSAETSSSERR